MKTVTTKLLVLSLFTLLGGGISASTNDSWIRVDATELNTGDIVVIADATTQYALVNNYGTTKAPQAESVAMSADLSQLTGDISENLQWEVTVENDTYRFNVPGMQDYLYCTSSNNGVRVGGNDATEFTWVSDPANANSTLYYLVNTATMRYIGLYNNQDWRCYTTINNNIKNTETAFYRKTTVSGENRAETSLVISEPLAELKVGTQYQLPAVYVVSGDVTLASDAITWTSTNEDVVTVADGVLTTLKPGRVTIKVEYPGNDDYLPSQQYLALTVLGDTYTSFAALQADASQAIAPVTIEFSGQQVVYAFGDNAFLTDQQGNGLLVYSKNHGLNAGDVIRGTATANLTLYQGNTEIIDFMTEGLTIVSGQVQPLEKAIGEIGKASQSTLVTIKGADYDSENEAFIQNGDTIKYYDKFGIGTTLLGGFSYDITGIVRIYNSTIEISPRTADDVHSYAIESAERITLAELEQRCYDGDTIPCILTFNDLLVAYKGANHTYLTDGERGMLLFGESGLTTGTRISGEITGIPNLYYGTPEFSVTTENVKVYELSSGNEVPRKPVTAAQLLENPRQWTNQYVVIENVRFDNSFTEDDYFRSLVFHSDSITFTLFNLFNRRWAIDSTAVYTLEGIADVNDGTIRIAPMVYTDLKKSETLPANAGTLERPLTVAEAISLASMLAPGEQTEQSYYVKGYVSTIVEAFTETYGNATFRISDKVSSGSEFNIYRTMYLENTAWKEGYTQISEGDEVIVYGQFTNYKGTLETASKQSYVYSLNGITVCSETIHTEGKKGDVNGDGVIDVTDVVMLIDYILERQPQGFNVNLADLNADGTVNVTDVVRLIDIVTNGQ